MRNEYRSWHSAFSRTLDPSPGWKGVSGIHPAGFPSPHYSQHGMKGLCTLSVIMGRSHIGKTGSDVTAALDQVCGCPLLSLSPCSCESQLRSCGGALGRGLVRKQREPESKSLALCFSLLSSLCLLLTGLSSIRCVSSGSFRPGDS